PGKAVERGTGNLANARLDGVDLGSKMTSTAGLAGLRTGKDLDIEKLSSNGRMAPNGIQADNFLAVVPSLGQLVGGGSIDAKNNLDFKMAATLTHALGGAASPVSGATGMLGKLTGGGSGCKHGGTTVPFLIQGTTSDPKFVPDVGGLAAGMLKAQLGCAAGVIPGAKGQQGQQQNPVDAITGLFKKKKPQ